MNIEGIVGSMEFESVEKIKHFIKQASQSRCIEIGVNSRQDVINVQKCLECASKNLNNNRFHPGKIDGIISKHQIGNESTISAIMSFQKYIGTEINGQVKPKSKTWKCLSSLYASYKEVNLDEINFKQDWMKIARREMSIGIKEFSGTGSNPSITKYLHASRVNEWADKSPVDKDETAWCASFVNWVLMQSKFTNMPTWPANALNWEKYGYPLSFPLNGAITILKHKRRKYKDSQRSGIFRRHVGFFVRKESNGVVLLTGNNKENTINEDLYKEKDWTISTFRWPYKLIFMAHNDPSFRYA